MPSPFPDLEAFSEVFAAAPLAAAVTGRGVLTPVFPEAADLEFAGKALTPEDFFKSGAAFFSGNLLAFVFFVSVDFTFAFWGMKNGAPLVM